MDASSTLRTMITPALALCQQNIFLQVSKFARTALCPSILGHMPILHPQHLKSGCQPQVVDVRKMSTQMRKMDGPSTWRRTENGSADLHATRHHRHASCKLPENLSPNPDNSLQIALEKSIVVANLPLRKGESAKTVSSKNILTGPRIAPTMGESSLFWIL